MQDTPLTAVPGILTDVPELDTRPGPSSPLAAPGEVRRLAVPDHAPPYDDQREDQLQGVTGGNAPLARPVTGDAARRDGAGDATGNPHAKRPGGEPGEASAEPPQARPGEAGASAWPSRFAQVLAETLAGARPARQLAPWTSEQARQRIRQIGQSVACDQRPTVRRIMTSAPAEDVLELTAVVGFGSRVRVLALRLERAQHGSGTTEGSRWCCTTIESA